MAIFYKHIKGCGENSIGSGDTDVWSWITWASSANNKNLKASQSYLPEVWVSKTNNLSAAKNCGKILTSDAIDQKVTQFMCFNQGLYASSIILTDADAENENIWYNNNTLYLDAINKNSVAGTMNFNARDFVFETQANGTSSFTVKSSAFFNSNTTIRSNLYVGPSMTYKFPTADNERGTIKADYKCEAKFFNATSDRRAKTDIKPASFSALSVVQSLPVYSFKYNTNPTPVIGLIAQEAAYHNLDGFNMVDNLLATGEDNDFMQMKESKLVYVLWKAVQELSDQVNDLKSQLASLK